MHSVCVHRTHTHTHARHMYECVLYRNLSVAEVCHGVQRQSANARTPDQTSKTVSNIYLLVVYYYYCVREIMAVCMASTCTHTQALTECTRESSEFTAWHFAYILFIMPYQHQLDV